jgi:hypothetical protein
MADAAPTWPTDLLAAVNAERAKLKLMPYLLDDRQVAAAGRQGEYLAGPAVPHLLGPGAVYAGWMERVAWANWPPGWPCGIACIAGPATPQGAVNGWMASLIDRNVILGDTYDCAGFANVTLRDGTHGWVICAGGMGRG